MLDTGYTWGLVLQGVIKKKKRRKKKIPEDEGDNYETEPKENWWSCMREEVAASARFPTIDQPIAEALCVLADLDTWHVGILSNSAPWQSPPLPVGMSRLVSNMLESFAYVWRKYQSPTYVSLFFDSFNIKQIHDKHSSLFLIQRTNLAFHHIVKI